jgi:hypothetical protein
MDMTGEKQHDILNLRYLSILYMCRLEDEKINDTLQMNTFASMNNKLWKMVSYYQIYTKGVCNHGT